MESCQLRATLLKVQDYLSDSDRKRLHFFFGNDVPRRIRDDPTLVGTINLMESLFDQDKINEQDISLLINAFEKIQCIDAMKILRGHMKQMQKSGENQSTQNLSSLLLQDQQEDKCAIKNLNFIQTTKFEDNSVTINSTTDVAVDRYSTQQKRKYLKKFITKRMKFLLLFTILLNVVLGIALSICTTKIIQLGKESKQKNIIYPTAQIERPSGKQDYCFLTKKLLNQMENLVWVDARDGDIPSSAFVGGQFGDRKIYVARIQWLNNIIPGQLVEGDKTAEAQYWGFVRNSTYQILTNPGSKFKFEWVSICGSELPACALSAGKEGTLTLFIGRTFHSSYQVVGKYNGLTGPFYYTYQGKGLETHNNIEVLCVL